MQRKSQGADDESRRRRLAGRDPGILISALQRRTVVTNASGFSSNQEELVSPHRSAQVPVQAWCPTIKDFEEPELQYLLMER